MRTKSVENLIFKWILLICAVSVMIAASYIVDSKILTDTNIQNKLMTIIINNWKFIAGIIFGAFGLKLKQLLI